MKLSGEHVYWATLGEAYNRLPDPAEHERGPVDVEIDVARVIDGGNGLGSVSFRFFKTHGYRGTDFHLRWCGVKGIKDQAIALEILQVHASSISEALGVALHEISMGRAASEQHVKTVSDLRRALVEVGATFGDAGRAAVTKEVLKMQEGDAQDFLRFCTDEAARHMRKYFGVGETAPLAWNGMLEGKYIIDVSSNKG